MRSVSRQEQVAVTPAPLGRKCKISLTLESTPGWILLRMARNGKAGPLGRAARMALAVGLAVITLPVYFDAEWGYVASTLALLSGLTGVYVVVHVAIFRYLSGVNRWGLAVVAVAPVFLVWFVGQGGGLWFRSGGRRDGRPHLSHGLVPRGWDTGKFGM